MEMLSWKLERSVTVALQRNVKILAVMPLLANSKQEHSVQKERAATIANSNRQAVYAVQKQETVTWQSTALDSQLPVLLTPTLKMVSHVTVVRDIASMVSVLPEDNTARDSGGQMLKLPQIFVSTAMEIAKRLWLVRDVLAEISHAVHCSAQEVGNFP